MEIVKKLKLVILFVVSLFFVPMITNAKEAINVYVFKSSTCPHCADAMKFFQELEKDSEYSAYFELVPYETNGATEEIQNNVNLANKVAKYYGKKFESVPLIVIADNYYEGYSSSMNDTLKKAIKKAYNNDNYVDVVKGIQDGTIKKSNADAIVTILIFLVLAGGIVYFVYLARKSTIEVDEVEEIEKEEDETKKKNTVSKNKSITNKNKKATETKKTKNTKKNSK